MKNLITNDDLNNLYKKGFVIKKNVLNLETIKKTKSIVFQNSEGKGQPDTHYPINLKSFFIKFLKLEFKKVLNSFYLLNLKNRLKLDYHASNIFKKPAELTMLDGYYNKKTNQEILPWHSDQAFGGEKEVKDFKSPDYFFYKFFVYLTSVGPGNGCTSYIPGSHLITYAVRDCIFKKEINYQPFWSISQLLEIINRKENFDLIYNKISNKELFNSFIKNAEICIKNKNDKSFDFNALPGDILIFNETGVHRGSKPVIDDRVVIRYLYKKKD